MMSASFRKRERNESKKYLSHDENEKKQKNEDDNNHIKEGINRMIKLIENWAEESSMSGVIDAKGNTRREDYEDVEEWIHDHRVVGKFTKRTQTFFAEQMALSVKDLAENQKEHCKKHDLESSTKITDLVHATKIGCIAGANVKLAADTWYQNQIEKGLEIEEGKIEIRRESTPQ